jgi:hypothetical protein
VCELKGTSASEAISACLKCSYKYIIQQFVKLIYGFRAVKRAEIEIVPTTLGYF